MSQRKKKKTDQPRVPPKVPGVQQVIGGPGPIIESQGETWQLGFNSQNAKARLEELFRAHVLREARKDRDTLGGEEGESAYQEARTAVHGGYYRTFADGWRLLLRSPVGQNLFLLSLILEHQPNATLDDAIGLIASDRDQVDDALLEISPDFFCMVAAQLAGEQKGDPEAAARAMREGMAAILPRTEKTPVRGPGSAST